MRQWQRMQWQGHGLYVRMHTDNTERIFLNDTTLRDGEQGPGISFDEQNKIRIVDLLLDVGVHEIEVGIAATLYHEKKFVEYLQKSSSNSRFGIWCRANIADIEKAMVYGFGKIHISIPVSDFQLSHMGKSRAWVLDSLKRCVNKVKEEVGFVSVGAQDATRADWGFLHDTIDLLNSLSVNRLRFSDTVGISTPSAIGELSRYIVQHFNGEVEFHGHNDLGMATANCISAAENGVNQLSTTTNGIGERAGNAPLEQVAAAMQFGLGMNCGIELKKLETLCHTVANAISRTIPVDAPVVGKNVFTHESGIHCHGQLKNSLMYQPFFAEEIGRKSELKVGKHSGSAAVCALLEKHGQGLTRAAAKKILTEAHNSALQINTENLLRLAAKATN